MPKCPREKLSLRRSPPVRFPKSKPKPEPPTELIKIKPIDIYSRRVPRELYNLINELFHPGYWRSEFTRESLININIIPETEYHT